MFVIAKIFKYIHEHIHTNTPIQAYVFICTHVYIYDGTFMVSDLRSSLWKGEYCTFNDELKFKSTTIYYVYKWF